MCKTIEQMREEAEARGEARGEAIGEAVGEVQGLLAAASTIVADGIASLDQVVKSLNLTKSQERALRAML